MTGARGDVPPETMPLGRKIERKPEPPVGKKRAPPETRPGIIIKDGKMEYIPPPK